MPGNWNSSLPDLPQVLITGKKTEKGENDKMIYTFTVTCGLDKATALFGIYGSDGRFLGVESLSLSEGKNDLSFSPENGKAVSYRLFLLTYSGGIPLNNALSGDLYGEFTIDE